jgi:hypothetical protein
MLDEPTEELVKIVVDLPDAEDGVGGEGLWAAKLGDDLYDVQNLPWHTLEINYRDVVRAIAPSEDMRPVFVEVVHRRGHRSIHVIFFDEANSHKDEVLARIKELGATYEGADSRLFAFDIKPEVDFDDVADYLNVCLENGWLDFSHAAQPQPKGTGDLVN